MILLKNIFSKLDGVVYILLAIIIVGFFLRAYSLSSDSLWIDEGYTIMQQRAISEHGYPLLMSGYKEIKDVLLPYALAGIAIFDGDEVFLFRLVAVIFGTLAIPVLFLIGRNLANKYIGIIAAFLIAFSYWHIAWSRQVRAYSVLVFFVLLSLFFLIEYEKSKRDKYLLLSLAAIAFAILAKSSFGILLLPAFAVYILLKRRYELLALCVSLGLILLIFFKKTLLDALSASVVNYFPYYFLDYFWQYFGIIFVIGLIGFYLAITQQRKYLHVHIFNAIYFIFPLIFFSFFSYINQKRYLFFVTPLLFIYAGYFIYYVALGFNKVKIKTLIVLIGITVLGVDFLTVKSVQVLPRKNYTLEYYTPQPNFSLAYDAINNEIGEKDLVLSPYPYMDLIYLKRFNYALDISYTGRADDSSLHNSREFYTGAESILSVEKLELMQKKENIYVVLDNMATGRINNEIYRYIKSHGKLIFENAQEMDQGIYVYRLARLEL